MSTSETSIHCDQIVIGGGITGLTAAWKSARNGRKTLLLEKSGRCGGSIQSTRTGDYLVEGGPHSLLVQDHEVESFLAESGLLEKSIQVRPEASRRFIVRKGQPVCLPDSAASFLFGSWLSPAGKARMLLEPFLHGKAPPGEEAIGPWSGRHFGKEVRHGLVDPFISGIYAGDPDRISLQTAFPRMAKSMGHHPSAVRSLLRERKLRKKESRTPAKRQMLSFPDGLEEMVRHLVDTGGFETHTNTQITAIRQTGESWRLEVLHKDTERKSVIECGSLLVCLPPHALAYLPFDKPIAEAVSRVREVEAPPVTTLALAFKRRPGQHPLNGFGILAPASEKRKILGILFDSTLFPGRAPDDEVLVSVFLGGMRQPEEARRKMETILENAKTECRDLLDLSGDPVYWKSCFWPRAIPQYDLDYRQQTAVLADLESRLPHLSFAGNARDGVALGACILSGLRKAVA